MPSVDLSELYRASLPIMHTTSIDEVLRVISLSKLSGKESIFRSVCSGIGEGVCMDISNDRNYAAIDPDLLQSFQRMKDAVSNCSAEASHYLSRLEAYRHLSVQGLPEALLAWASLKSYGFESPSSPCPFSLRKTNVPDTFTDQKEAFAAYIGALYLGEPRAILPIAHVLSSGLGSLYANTSFEEIMDGVPLPERLHSDASLFDMANLLIARSMVVPSSIIEGSNMLSIGNGLLLFACMLDVEEARAILSHRFEYGIGVDQDFETSLFYVYSTAKEAAVEFHVKGGEPIAERDRIDDLTERTVFKGNLGDEDELIQHQIIKAKEGDIAAILAMGDLYYYGARGMPRDQILARQYFSDAASRGSLEGICGLAGMQLKGEGGEQNLTSAIKLYESAASQGSIRALNGLGYLYFFGNDIEKNEVGSYLRFSCLFDNLICSLKHSITSFRPPSTRSMGTLCLMRGTV